MSSTRQPHPVVIVGAGPTGLVMALWLTRLGVPVRIVDEAAEPSRTTRAIAVQARTLEHYRQIGLAAAVVERGREITAANLWVSGRHAAHAVFGDMGRGLSPFPYALAFGQDEHERLLIERLQAAGVTVDRALKCTKVEQTDDVVRVQLARADGSVETCECQYLAGCDGARSVARTAIGAGFPGGTYEHIFYVADVDARGPAMNGELHVAFAPTDFLALFPLKGERRARLVGTVRPEAVSGGQAFTWDDVSRDVIEQMRIEVDRVNWFSTYHVHHRVAGHFRDRRIFLAGDAAHIHSPVGGQGMNTGICDAINLSWKLAAVLAGRAHASVLDTYEPERIAFARRLVHTTDRAFTAVTSSTRFARFVRLYLTPIVLPGLFQLTAVRRFMFRTVSQTAIEYREGGMSEGRAGRVQGGDRLPWVPSAAGASAPDNFTPLESLTWQVHVYGAATPAIVDLCRERSLPLHVFAWNAAARKAGLARDALYLLRPDGYVGLADEKATPSTLRLYLESRGIT